MVASKFLRVRGVLSRLAARPVVALAATMAVAIGTGASYKAVGQDGQPETLSGTWNVNVALTNCQTGAVLPIPQNPFPALNTYGANGTVMETGSRTPFRSPGHGKWERVGHNEFVSQLKFFRFAPDGTPIGTQEVTRQQKLIDNDNYVAEAQVVLRDTAGNQVGGGCARETATRF